MTITRITHIDNTMVVDNLASATAVLAWFLQDITASASAGSNPFLSTMPETVRMALKYQSPLDVSYLSHQNQLEQCKNMSWMSSMECVTSPMCTNDFWQCYRNDTSTHENKAAHNKFTLLSACSKYDSAYRLQLVWCMSSQCTYNQTHINLHQQTEF